VASRSSSAKATEWSFVLIAAERHPEPF